MATGRTADPSTGVSTRHARLIRRAQLLERLRSFFVERDYLEVETPILVPSPGLDLHLDAFATAQPHFGQQPGYLITSPEYQMKRLLSEGLPRIFQLVRCFRRGERGHRHNPEFTMVEWYRAGATMELLMAETEDLVRALLADATHMPLAGADCDVTRPFARMTVVEAFARWAEVDESETLRLADEDEDRYFFLLVDRVEPGLARLGVPVFLHDYPASQASLARTRPDDPRFAERFELYVGEAELCNGFGELTCPIEQRQRLERDQATRRERGMPVYPVDERFLAALEAGMPDCAGNALGVDRLVALALGADSIDEVMTFPVDAL